MTLLGTAPVLPGIVASSGDDNRAPILGVIAEEKTGKSSLGTTLFGWPEPHMQPLYIAWDETGPDSCLNLGYRPHKMRPKSDFPGGDLWSKTRNMLASLEANQTKIRASYGAFIIDCASVMNDKLYELARQKNDNNPDPRAAYGDLLKWSGEFMNRITDLGMPTIWLAWLKPPEINEEKDGRGQKRRRQVQGTYNITGNFKFRLAGKAHHTFYLEKRLIGVGAPEADAHGYQRILHSVPFQNIASGGRYSHVLPPECPAHLGMILTVITGRNSPKPQ